jgi:hypothetical protein
VGQRGRIALDFARESTSAWAAIASAVQDVKRAIPGAELIEASPDFVGLSDVADIAGFTRQNMRKLMLSNIATFPLAVHEGTPSLWASGDGAHLAAGPSAARRRSRAARCREDQHGVEHREGNAPPAGRVLARRNWRPLFA